MSNNVAVGYVHPSHISADFIHNLHAMFQESKRVTRLIPHESGPNISTGRNAIVEQFLLGRDEDWLLMVDTDMLFTPTAVDRLLASADETLRPVVSGLCYAQLFTYQHWGGRPRMTWWATIPRSSCHSAASDSSP